MINRFWDKDKRYTQGFLKEFRHWVWEVSYRQHTLGSFIIFAKRPVEHLWQLKSTELASLGKIIQEIEETFSRIKIFKPDWFNYWQMGNNLHHLHIHGFPRYQKPRLFNSKKWVDKTWGHPPIWSKKDVSHELVAQIRDAIKHYLKK